MRTAGYLLILLLALAASSANARHHYPRADSDAQAGHFDYYLLSLSWAPTYCLTHSDDGAECGTRGYGFVVHGLWPQYDAGGYPANCATQFDVTADAASKGRTLYPSESLMRHEWQEHGSCSGLEPLNYFIAVDRATAAVKIPAALEAPRINQSLTAAQIGVLFQSANSQMPRNALTVACRSQNLLEVRICLTKDLSVRTCGQNVRFSCPRTAVTIPASR